MHDDAAADRAARSGASECASRCGAGEVVRLWTIAVLLAIPLGGCAPDLTALAQDQNALCVRATYVYGSVEINRNHGCEPQAAPAPAK